MGNLKMLDEVFAENVGYKQLLIHEGVPYSLKHLNIKDGNNPCGKCDLFDSCYDDFGVPNFRKLCEPDGLDSSWYFEEDWDLLDKRVSDFYAPDYLNCITSK